MCSFYPMGDNGTRIIGSPNQLRGPKSHLLLSKKNIVTIPPILATYISLAVSTTEKTLSKASPFLTHILQTRDNDTRQ